jgi:hypothetical protein
VETVYLPMSPIMLTFNEWYHDFDSHMSSGLASSHVPASAWEFAASCDALNDGAHGNRSPPCILSAC